MFLLLGPFLVYAAESGKDKKFPISSLDTLFEKTVCQAANWLFTFAMFAGIITIMLAAFKYFTAAGDTQKVQEVHKMIWWGIVGIAVAIISWGVPSIVGDFLLDSEFENGCL